MTINPEKCAYKVFDEENNMIRYEQKYTNGQLYWSIDKGYNRKWFDNGQLWKEYYMINNKMDKYYKEWYRKKEYSSDDSIQLYIHEEYKDGYKDGTCTYWYENGKIMSQTIYKKDVVYEEKEWYENGQLQYVITYKDEKYNGEQTEYHSNGVLKFKINLVENEKSGEYIEYDEKGESILKMEK